MGGRQAGDRSVVESVSADDADASIPKYWIVNPAEEMITVLTLEDGVSLAHGVFHCCETATSVLLTGFAVHIDAVCDAE
jgi:hypothetical protein